MLTSLFNVVFKKVYYGVSYEQRKFFGGTNPNFYKRALILNHTDEIGEFILANTAKRESKWYSSDKGYISLAMIHPEFKRRDFGKVLVEEALNF